MGDVKGALKEVLADLKVARIVLNVKKAPHSRCSPGAGPSKKCRSFKYPPPTPWHWHCYCTLQTIVRTCHCQKLKNAFLLFVQCPPPSFFSSFVWTTSKHSFQLFITLFISIDFEWCAGVWALFCNKECRVPPNTSLHPVPLCDNLRVNILCRSSHFNSAANPISAIVWWYTVHCCWSYYLMIYTADHTQISRLFCPRSASSTLLGQRHPLFKLDVIERLGNSEK